MLKDELAKYIRNELERGASKDKILEFLKVGGWSEADIQNGFVEYEKLKKSGVYEDFKIIPSSRMGIKHHILSGIFLTIVALLALLMAWAYIVGGNP